MMALPPLLPAPDIHDRLQAIFPEGTENRNYVTREMAAKTVFVMLYIGAIEGAECWLRPDQVTRMTDAQAGLVEHAARGAWLQEPTRRALGSIEGRWYARVVLKREPARFDATAGSENSSRPCRIVIDREVFGGVVRRE